MTVAPARAELSIDTDIPSMARATLDADVREELVALGRFVVARES